MDFLNGCNELGSDSPLRPSDDDMSESIESINTFHIIDTNNTQNVISSNSNNNGNSSDSLSNIILPTTHTSTISTPMVVPFYVDSQGRMIHRPSKSYTTMITEAILSSPGQRASLSAIYDYLAQTYPYFSFSKKSWQNSVRHNLSISKAFQRVPRDRNQLYGKGMLWTLRQNPPGQTSSETTTTTTNEKMEQQDKDDEMEMEEQGEEDVDDELMSSSIVNSSSNISSSNINSSDLHSSNADSIVIQEEEDFNVNEDCTRDGMRDVTVCMS